MLLTLGVPSLFFLQVKDEARLTLRLGGRRDVVELELLYKNPHRFRHGKADAEAILQPPLYLPAYEQFHI